jgi:hypothetical protein
MSQQTHSKPIRKVRSGLVTASVWENPVEKGDGETVTLHSIRFQRSYQDSEGQWKNTDSFTPQSLGPLLITIIRLALEFSCKVDDDTQEDE